MARTSSPRSALNPGGTAAEPPALGSTRSTIGALVGTTSSPAVESEAPLVSTVAALGLLAHAPSMPSTKVSATTSAAPGTPVPDTPVPDTRALGGRREQAHCFMWPGYTAR